MDHFVLLHSVFSTLFGEKSFYLCTFFIFCLCILGFALDIILAGIVFPFKVSWMKSERMTNWILILHLPECMQSFQLFTSYSKNTISFLHFYCLLQVKCVSKNLMYLVCWSRRQEYRWNQKQLQTQRHHLSAFCDLRNLCAEHYMSLLLKFSWTGTYIDSKPRLS